MQLLAEKIRIQLQERILSISVLAENILFFFGGGVIFIPEIRAKFHPNPTDRYYIILCIVDIIIGFSY
jgi:hypothetical protein